jgi:hypothetical protein
MKNLLEKLHTPTWLFVLLSFVLLLRIPSFFEPYSYGDEMIYMTLGQAVRQGIPLYSQIHDNKPPLLYLIAAISENLFWFKVILAFWNIITIFSFWKLTEVIFPSSKHQKLRIVSTIILSILTTIPLLEGNIVNAELFMIGFTILGFYSLLSRRVSTMSLMVAGLLFSISALFKLPAAFDIPAIVLYWIVSEDKMDKNSIVKILKRTILLGIFFLIPIALTFVWYYLQGAAKDYLVAAFMQNFGYLSSWRVGTVKQPFLVKNGPLLIRAGIVLFSFVTLLKFKKLLSKEFIFISFWTVLTLFAVTLSERPYPHYLIQSIPPVSLLFGILFTYKNIEQIVAIVPLFLTFLAPSYYKFWIYPTFSYYERFINFEAKKISWNNYMQSFGPKVVTNYKISEFVINTTSPKDRVFVWGDGVSIYALSRRLPPYKYVAGYHIKDFSSQENVLSALTKNLPTLIIILPDSEPFLALDYFVRKNYGQVEVIDGAQIWRLLNANIRSLLSRGS